MSEQTQYPDLTPEEFEFELRDHRKIAYNEYLRFKADRTQRKSAFKQAQTKRCAPSRWLHAKIQAWRDSLDNKHEAELLHEVNQHSRI